MARKRSKSLPELESVEEAGSEQSQQQQRPASVEGVVKQQKSSSSEEPSSSKSGSSSSPSKLHNASGSQQQQRGRLYSTPVPHSLRGTVPLSHTPSTLPKVSMAGAQFSVPRMNYSPLHHSASHGSMYAGFPGYQPYNTTSPGMPTQAAYPPTYNPYSGSTGSSYMGPSGPPGSALYNTNSLIHSTSYSSHPNMLNYMPYSTNLQASDSKLHQGSSTLMPYNTQQSYPYNSVATGGVGVVPGSSTSAAVGSYPSLPAVASTNQELSHISQPSIPTASSVSTSLLPPTLHSSVPTSMVSMTSQRQEVVMPSNDRGHSGSPQDVRSPLDRVVGCDSTTTGAEASAETGDVDNHTRSEDKNSVLELQYYSTRYVHRHEIT